MPNVMEIRSPAVSPGVAAHVFISQKARVTWATVLSRSEVRAMSEPGGPLRIGQRDGEGRGGYAPPSPAPAPDACTRCFAPFWRVLRAGGPEARRTFTMRAAASDGALLTPATTLR